MKKVKLLFLAVGSLLSAIVGCAKSTVDEGLRPLYGPAPDYREDSFDDKSDEETQKPELLEPIQGETLPSVDEDLPAMLYGPPVTEPRKVELPNDDDGQIFVTLYGPPITEPKDGEKDEIIQPLPAPRDDVVVPLYGVREYEIK